MFKFVANLEKIIIMNEYNAYLILMAAMPVNFWKKFKMFVTYPPFFLKKFHGTCIKMFLFFLNKP